MRQLKLTGFIFFLLSLTESLTLPSKPQDVDDFSATQKFIDKNTASLAIIAFSQHVQEGSFEEAEILVRTVLEHRDECLADGTLPQCSKTANNALQEMMCSLEGLPHKLNYSHCCSKLDFERRRCFFYNKKTNVGFLPPFPNLDPEESCQAYKDNRESFLSHYVYEVARRNPFIFAPFLLAAVARFEKVVITCCEEPQEASCFLEKAAPVSQYLKALSAYHKNACGILMKFGPKVLNSINIVLFSKTFPRIGFKQFTSLLEDVFSMYEGCCEGDVVQCFRKQSRVMDGICLNQASVSRKLQECCRKPSPEREDCLVSFFDDRPEDLAPRLPKFTDSDSVCQERDADPDHFFTEFMYEYSRRHSHLSTSMLLRIEKVYKDLLADCCDREKPSECYRHAEEKFNETTQKSLAMVQQECKLFQDLGQEDLKYYYLIKFTKVAPQLSPKELISLSKEMVIALTTGCPLSRWVSKVDNLADLVLGDLCRINDNRPINPPVDHCCQANLALRRPCFEGLKADEMYRPPSVSQDPSAFSADWCQAQNPEFQDKQSRFLVNLVRQKLEVPNEELLSLFTNVTRLWENCCGAQDPEACFNQERPKIGN